MGLIVALVAVFTTLVPGALVIARLRIARESRYIERNRARSRRNRAYHFAWNLVRRHRRSLLIEYHETAE